MWSTRGTEKILTKNGASFVAIIDANRLDFYHALEAEHANLILLDEAEVALEQVKAGKTVGSDALKEALTTRMKRS